MHRARVPQALTLAVSMAACSSTPPAVPDGGAPDVDAAPDADGAVDPTTRGLTVRFGADPALPVRFQDGDLEVSIDSISLRLDDLRVIGDSAPGDERTRIDSLLLRWPADDDGSGGDVAIEYADAPPGIYSLFRASVVSFEIDGEVDGDWDGEDGRDYEFEIERGWGRPIAIQIELGSAPLEPGGTIELTTHFDARQAVASVPWSELSPDGEGDVEIGSDDSIMDDVEAALVDSFSLSELD